MFSLWRSHADYPMVTVPAGDVELRDDRINFSAIAQYTIKVTYPH